MLLYNRHQDPIAVTAQPGGRLKGNGYALGVVELVVFERRLSALFPEMMVLRSHAVAESQGAALAFAASFASHLRPSFALEFDAAQYQVTRLASDVP